MIASNLSPDGVRVWVAVEPVDMRKGFDGLACPFRDPRSGRLHACLSRSQRSRVSADSANREIRSPARSTRF